MMTDLFDTAMAWIQDQRLPEPESMQLIHGNRIELNYLDTTASDLPTIEWTPTKSGNYAKSEHQLDSVRVSVYAPQGEAA